MNEPINSATAGMKKSIELGMYSFLNKNNN